MPRHWKTKPPSRAIEDFFDKYKVPKPPRGPLCKRDGCNHASGNHNTSVRTSGNVKTKCKMDGCTCLKFVE